MVGEIISVQSGKGGVGKTTVALNLAMSLAKDYGKRVLLVDGNISTPHIHIYVKDLDLSKLTLDDILRGKLDFDIDAIQKLDALHILPSRGVRDPDSFSIDDYKSVLYTLKPEFDYIILDSSPGIGTETIANISASDSILFVSGPYVPDAVDVIRIRDLAENMGKKSIGVVLNKVRLFGNHVKPRDMETVSGMPVVGKIPFDHSISKAMALGVPAVHAYPRSKASAEIRRIAALISGEKPRVGLLARIRPF